MKKTSDAARKSPTHFEQIPLDVVKKSVQEDVAGNIDTATGGRSADPAPAKTALRSALGRAPHRTRR